MEALRFWPSMARNLRHLSSRTQSIVHVAKTMQEVRTGVQTDAASIARSECLLRRTALWPASKITGSPLGREGVLLPDPAWMARRSAEYLLNYTPQRNAAVWTGASQRRFISSSSSDTVTEQPAMSSEVTKLPTSDRATVQPAISTP
jgi:hypothetical protein